MSRLEDTVKKASPRRTKSTRAANQQLVALTLKIDSETYIRLSTLRAKERKTAQEILAEALQEYLRKAEA
jgi:hypothetical protein